MSSQAGASSSKTRGRSNSKRRLGTPRDATAPRPRSSPSRGAQRRSRRAAPDSKSRTPASDSMSDAVDLTSPETPREFAFAGPERFVSDGRVSSPAPDAFKERPNVRSWFATHRLVKDGEYQPAESVPELRTAWDENEKERSHASWVEDVKERLFCLDHGPRNPDQIVLRPRPIAPEIPEFVPPENPPLPDEIPDSAAPYLNNPSITGRNLDRAKLLFRAHQAKRLQERLAAFDSRDAAVALALERHELEHTVEYRADLAKWEDEKMARDANVAEFEGARLELEDLLAPLLDRRRALEVLIKRRVGVLSESSILRLHLRRLRDEVAYVHEMYMSIDGPSPTLPLGEDMEIFCEAAHLGDPPPGFTYREFHDPFYFPPSDVGPSKPGVPVSVAPPFKSAKSKGKEHAVDPVVQGVAPASLPNLRKIVLYGPNPDFVPPPPNKKRKASLEGDERPGKSARLINPARSASGTFTTTGHDKNITFPLLDSSCEPTVLPPGFTSWRAFLEQNVRAPSILLKFGSRLAIARSHACK
ncbi:hypothetical protein B0H16DRAFT_1752945, partial [Mycena metata]